MRYYNFIFKALIILMITLSFIILDVKLTLNFTPLYNFDISYLNIEASSGIKKSEMKENYQYLVHYLNTKEDLSFKLPSIEFSDKGKIHFEEVKKIFVKLDYLLYLCLFLGIPGGLYLYNKQVFSFIKGCALGLFILPAILIFPFLLDFNKSFVLFHKLAFSNDYWEFDPKLDPIINILPQDFFFHCALLILLLILVESTVLYVFYKKSKSNRKKIKTYL